MKSPTKLQRARTLETLFLDELADMYDAENRLTRALPKLAKCATHGELREVFQTHLAETKGHVRKLQSVFRTFGRTPRGRKCEAIRGLLKEGDDIASSNKSSPTINAALISAAQKVEHYEIASYGCLREWAEQLGQEEAARLLEEILDEEKAADLLLTGLARGCCNETARLGGEAEAQPATDRASAVFMLT
jgi:ferritin-like metal-binding protein YciE